MAWDHQALVRSRTIVHGHLHLHQLTAWKALTTRHPSAAKLLMARSRLSGLNDPPITLYSIYRVLPLGPSAWGSAGSGQLRDEPGGVNGADPGDEVVSGPGPVALDRDGLAALREADRVAALGDVDEAGRVLLLQAVERRVDEPELLMRVLVGDGDDACELRRRRAGPPAGSPDSRRPGEGLEDGNGAAERAAHRHVRDAAPVPGHAAHRVLVGGPGEDRRQASAAGPRQRAEHLRYRRVAAVVPGGVGGGPVPGRV